MHQTPNLSWRNFILHGANDESRHNQKIGFIHFKGINQNPSEELFMILSDFFSALDIFKVSDNTGLIIVDGFPEHFDDEFLEILDLITHDLNLKLEFLIGNIHTTSKETPVTFKKEHEYLKHLDEKFQYLSQIYIEKTLPQTIELELLYPSVYELIKKDHEIQDMIQKLWETDGNVAQSASELYIHRNTLIYRLNKFQEDTQLDLKNSNDRLIGYLLTLRYLCKQ